VRGARDREREARNPQVLNGRECRKAQLSGTFGGG